MNELLTWGYWFNGWPEPLSKFGMQILAGFCLFLLILILIIIKSAYPQKWLIYRSTFKKLVPFALTNIIISVYIYGVNSQLIPVLRARAWYVVWGIIMIIWLITIIRNARKRLARKEELAKEAELKKYIP